MNPFFKSRITTPEKRKRKRKKLVYGIMVRWGRSNYKVPGKLESVFKRLSKQKTVEFLWIPTGGFY